MANYVSYIQDRLTDKFSTINNEGGADFDQNGKIDSHERLIDINRNGVMDDSDDWQALLKRNNTAISRYDPFFKWGNAFQADNPIHELLHCESEVSSPGEILSTYQFVARVLQEARSRNNQTPLARDKLKIVYDILAEMRIPIANGATGLLSKAIHQPANEKTLNCATSNFILLAVAHELGWPVSAVLAPGVPGVVEEHLFVRWEDKQKGIYLNGDQGRVFSDEYYIISFSISEKSRQMGVYLASLTPRELIGLFIFSRGTWKTNLGHYEAAIEDFNKGLIFYPQCAWMYINRGSAELKLGRFRSSLYSYQKAVELNPDDTVRRHNLMVQEAFPLRYDLTLHPIFDSKNEEHVDTDYSLSATWFPFGPPSLLSGGLRLEVDYASVPGNNPLGLSIGPALLYSTKSFSLLLDTLWRRYFFTDCKDVKGNFAKHELQLALRLNDYLSVGSSFSVVHNLRHAFLMPGLFLSLTPDFTRQSPFEILDVLNILRYMQIGIEFGAGRTVGDSEFKGKMTLFPTEITIPIIAGVRIGPCGNCGNLYFRFTPELTVDWGSPAHSPIRAGGRLGLGALFADVNFRAGSTLASDPEPYVGAELAVLDLSRVVIPGIVFSWERYLGHQRPDSQNDVMMVSLRWAVLWEQVLK